MRERFSFVRSLRNDRTGQVGMLVLFVGFGCACGCGTTRMTDTARAGTEMLLVSNAVDEAVARIDLSCLTGKTVFFDAQYLDGVVDKGYLVSTLRQQLLATGCILQEDKTKAAYVVEVRSGGLGTDKHSVMVGIPQMSVPTLVPGVPSQIPEIPFAKKTDQQGVAKIALFAYNRQTGRALWQSGIVESMSTARDTWLMGAGPFRRGSIVKGTEFAGAQLPMPHFHGKEEAPEEHASYTPPPTQAAYWRDQSMPIIESKQLLLATAQIDGTLSTGEWNKLDAQDAVVRALTNQQPVQRTPGIQIVPAAQVAPANQANKPAAAAPTTAASPATLAPRAN